MIINVKTASGGYDITLEGGVLNKINTLINLNRKCLVVTDSGVPQEYSNTVCALCKEAVKAVIPMGEASKNMDSLNLLLEAMVKNNFTRSDCVVAVGGGVVGDLSGFAAACFMRGIDFYNIPTTVLSQVDSSIGGKTAIDFMGVKNIVGAFYPPKAVIIDTDTLKTLDKRQISNGLAESVKMAACFDEKLFSLFENEDVFSNLPYIIEKSLLIKKYVVELDEKESGLRRVLNFGHTVGHAIESLNPNLYHGECVALGMLYMCSMDIKARLIKIYESLNLPTKVDIESNALQELILHDKKFDSGLLNIIKVEKIGEFIIEKIEAEKMLEILRQV